MNDDDDDDNADDDNDDDEDLFTAVGYSSQNHSGPARPTTATLVTSFAMKPSAVMHQVVPPREIQQPNNTQKLDHSLYCALLQHPAIKLQFPTD